MYVNEHVSARANVHDRVNDDAHVYDYVLQQLLVKSSLLVYYWTSENSRGELDFLLQDEEKIIPVEVKAEENLQSKSLKTFVERNPGLHGVRFSMSPYREQDWLTNYPLYSLLAVL